MASTNGSSPPPPGLGEAPDQGSVGSVNESHAPLTAEQQALADRIRDAVLAEIDGRMKARTDEAFQRGKDMMNKMQQSTNDKVAQLRKELSQCQEKVNMLEAANLQFSQAWAQLDKHTRSATRMYGCMDFAASLAVASPPMTPQQNPSSLRSPPLWRPPGMQEQASPERLGDIPSFPAVGANGSPPPLSLADTLSAPAQRTPLSLAESLGPPASSDASSVAAPDAGTKVVEFSFTIRKADGMELGLNVSHQDHDQTLHVEGVRQDGAVDAWNRQCSGHAADKAVRPGDTIVSVNSVTKNPAKMLEECRNKHTLKLIVHRTVEAEPSGAAGAPSLRAGASVFVPRAQSNPHADP